jgi:hypothetical protein
MADLKNFNHVDLLFPSKYAKAADLRGKTVIVEIERIDPREKLMMAGGKSDQKPVVYLKGKEKGWILNKTNARSIAKVYGNEVMQWIGKPVAIYSASVEARGEMVDAIRVNVDATRKAAAGAGAKIAPPPDQDIDEQQLADAAREAEQGGE